MAQACSITTEELSTRTPFSWLAPSIVAQILKEGRFVELRPGQRFSQIARDTNGESYGFVLDGQVAVVLVSSGPKRPDDKAEVRGQDMEFVGSFGPGDLFSDGFLDIAPRENGPALDCMAATKVTLLAVPATVLSRILRDQQDWASRLFQTVTDSRRRFLANQEPSRRVVQDFFLRRGYGSSRRIRVAEMSRCLDCDKCEKACAERHGHKRMTRAYAHLGRLAFHKFCVNCMEHACLAACPFGAMVVTQAGEIQITKDCTGCGACARKCPFAAIEIVDVSYTAADFPCSVPATDPNGQTAVAGLFAVGDICGPRPTKVAVEEARRAVDAMRPQTLAGAGGRSVFDAVIVGAGVAGLAAAERCQERQLNFLVVEKNPQLSAKARRRSSAIPILAGTEIKAVAVSADGLLRVEGTQGSHVARNVLVCTGKPEPGCPSLLTHAGVPMIEPGTAEMEAYIAGRGTHPVAIKCDNCAGYPDRACLRACPTSSMVELTAQELFLERGPDARQTASFSPVAFVEGVAEQRARARHHRVGYAIFSWLLILVLIGIGIECYLRRALPEYSVEGMARVWLGAPDSIWYKSGRGFGHGLGYVGTAFMLLTLLYPLRTRCGVLKSWGAQSTWLRVHMWVGFIGATLVTYHAAFELDRWVALACYSMWLVVLSGAIGRYLYGMLRSGIGLVEFERNALWIAVTTGTVSRTLGTRWLRLITPGTDKPGPIATELFVMLWHELRDFAVVLWLRLAGLSHLSDREARRQSVQLFSALASYRRSRRYLESARRLVRPWNWVHIILTITMFVLAGFHIAYGFMYKAV